MILCYEGDRDWVERTINGSIHGERVIGDYGSIKAATIGDFPEVLEEPKLDDRPEPPDDVFSG